MTALLLKRTSPQNSLQEPAPTVEFQSVSKRFSLHHERARSFQDLWIRLMRRQVVNNWEEFWALRDLSFEVQKGEILGVIGSNGSGKSTLLRLAARTVRPTRGRIVLRGNVAPLLELGAGFHPELSGQDNVYLNGGLLGMSRATISARFKEIVEFAELERFIDTPMKHYSSGMWIRLGFSVAAHSEADVFLIDEALAVGDEAFQRKCLARINDFRQRGKTILFVSHDLGQVAQMCDRALWLRQGQAQAIGPAGEVVAAYVEASEAQAAR